MKPFYTFILLIIVITFISTEKIQTKNSDIMLGGASAVKNKK